MAARIGVTATVARIHLARLLVVAVVLTGCAAPTPVDLGTVAGTSAPEVAVRPTTAPATTTPAATAEPAPVQPLASATPVAPGTSPALRPPAEIRPPAGAPSPRPDPSPVTFPPPVTTPDPVLPPVTVPDAPPAGRSADDLAGAVADAQRVVDGYWARHWSEFFTGSYTPPRVVGLYDGTGQDVPTCGGEPLPPVNAVYCVPEDYLAWDVTLMGLRTQIGDSWPYLVVAHEWGHSIQARLDASLNSVAVELQADCLAGAALYGAVADGTLTLGDGAAREIATALAAAGDETPWTTSRDHGNAEQRTGAFDAGRIGGVRACLPPG